MKKFIFYIMYFLVLTLYSLDACAMTLEEVRTQEDYDKLPQKLKDKAVANGYKFPIEVGGTIVDSNGQIFKENVQLEINVAVLVGFDEFNNSILDVKKYDKTVSDGHFHCELSDGIGASIKAMKDGYYDGVSVVGTSEMNSGNEPEIVANNILIYMIPKGELVNLECTDNAYILPIDDETVGWSFKRRWYYPADQYDVLMKCYTEDKKNAVLEMKEGGGFVEFEGYPYFEGNSKDIMKSFELMTEAPEMGYEQKIIITPALRDIARNQGLYYYFRTPDGKYGKMKIHGFGKGMVNFSYYLNPTGSRSLELKESISKYPQNPKALGW